MAHLSSLCYYLQYLRAAIAQSVQRRATAWAARVLLPAGTRYFSPLHSVQTGLVSNGYREGSSWGGVVEQPGLKSDLSPPANAKVKNSGAIPPTTIRLHVIVCN
jgi:hypothetical protein